MPIADALRFWDGGSAASVVYAGPTSPRSPGGLVTARDPGVATVTFGVGGQHAEGALAIR